MEFVSPVLLAVGRSLQLKVAELMIFLIFLDFKGHSLSEAASF